jgi:hypothetical protein
MPSPRDYDSLRGYVPARPRDPSSEQPSPEATKVSVMDWLIAVGRAVARKVKPVPASPMLRIHARR